MKNTSAIYWNWTWAFRQHSELCLLLQTILTLSLRQRKEWLGLSRTQSPPVPGSYLESTLSCIHDNILLPLVPCSRYDEVRYTSVAMREVYDHHFEPFLNPETASIIALATRISPNTTKEEYESMLFESVAKELNAAVHPFPCAEFDFRPIFSSDPDHRWLPLTDRLPVDPEVAEDTFQIMQRLRRTLEGRLFLPSIGTKTVGSKVAEEFWRDYQAGGFTFKHDGRFGPEDQVTTRDCLKLYELTGGRVQGPVEVRSSWKYAQIAPRVYYARGGSVVPSSEYIQPIINQIIDAFPETHRLNRFSPPEERLDPEDVEVIYDYASFTSRIEAIKSFVAYLAIFFRGVSIQILDVHKGILEQDLGILFSRYNSECNEFAWFDPSKVLSRWFQDVPLLQHTCGMLGVEGNIFLATLLHGIHLRFIAGLKRSKCVGDDARLHYSTDHGVLTSDDTSTLTWQLSGLGDINEEKLAKFEPLKEPIMQAFKYVKRPLHRDIDIMIEGVMLDLPSLIPLLPLADEYHTIIPSATHPCRQTFKAIVRLLRVLKVHQINWDTSPEGIQCIAKHVYYLRDEIRKQDPLSIHSPFARSDLKTHYQLPPMRDWGKVEYEDWIMDGLGIDQELRFLKRGGSEFDGLLCDGRAGSSMVRESNGKRSLLEKLGYLDREDLYDVVSYRSIGPEELKVYLSGNYRVVCKFNVVDDIPSWYACVPDTL